MQAGGIIGAIIDVIYGIIKAIAIAIYYFYVHILPFLIKYIGIPMFLLGCAISGGFAISFLFIIIGGFALYSMYIKKLWNISPPIVKKPKTQQQ